MKHHGGNGGNGSNLTVAIASDHAGLVLKRALCTYLEEKGISVCDLGVSEPVRCDYPDYAHKVCQAIQQGDVSSGILVCGTGVGMSMTANKHRGIRAAVVSDVFSARATKQHNNANVLCLGERVVGVGLAQEIVDAWLETDFEGGRHQARIDKLMSWDCES
jgi:ribose 5-phosphate isomerase B